MASTVISEEVAEAKKLTDKKYVGFEFFHVQNGEKCYIGDYIIVSKSDSRFSVGKVLEILQVNGSEAELERRPDYVLLSICDTAPSEMYRMPKLLKTALCLLGDYKVFFKS